MRTAAFAAVAALVVSLAIPAHADNGGKVWAYAQRSKHAQRINWPCKSACTLALSNPRTCAGPNAVFVFHAVHSAGRHNRRITQWVFNQYPPAVRSWIRARGGLTTTPITLKGAELRKRVRPC